MAHSGDRVRLWPELPGDLGRLARLATPAWAAALRGDRGPARQRRRPAAGRQRPARACAAGAGDFAPVVGPAAGPAPPALRRRPCAAHAVPGRLAGATAPATPAADGGLGLPA